MTRPLQRSRMSAIGLALCCYGPWLAIFGLTIWGVM